MKYQKGFKLIKVVSLIVLLVRMDSVFAQAKKVDILNQLQSVDSLMNVNEDARAKEILDAVLPVVEGQTTEVQVQFYAFLGGYYLGTSRFQESIAAYEDIYEVSTKGLSKDVRTTFARAINDLGIAYFKNGEVQKAKRAHLRSLTLYEGDPQGKSFNYGNLAIIYKELKLLDSAYHCYELAQEADILAQDTLGMGFHSLSLGILQVDNNEPIKGLENLNQALKIFRQLKNDRMVHYTNRQLAGTYRSIGDYSVSGSLLFESKDYFKSSGDIVRFGQTNIALGELYFAQQKHDSAFLFVKEALTNFDSARYVKGLIQGYNLVGRYYVFSGDYPRAIENYNTSIELSGDSFKGMTANSSIALSRIALLQDRLSDATRLAKSAFQISEGSLPEGSERSYYEILYEVNKRRGNLSKALKNLEILERLKSESFNQERANDIARIEYRAKLDQETERLELEKRQQAELYEKELERERLIQQGAIGGGVLALIILIVLYRSNQLKKQKNKELSEKNSAITQLRETEKKMAEETLALKERELTTITMLSHERNSLLQQLGNQIGGLSDKVDDEVIPDLKEIKRTINSNLSEESWSAFMYQFEKVHPEFFNGLKEKFPNLTQHDLRICAYLRVGMERKEIATITNTTPEAAKKSLYRLKKKMELDAETDLREFLMSI